MLWVSIILGIIQALPEIITVIKDILAMIHGHPQHVLAFQALLLKHADYVDPGVAKADLTAFHASLTSAPPHA